MVIGTTHGYAQTPGNEKIVDLANGIRRDVGVIIDKEGELEPLVVFNDISVRYLTADEEEELVTAAISLLPEYQVVKATELPYPTPNATDDEWEKWMDSFRLRFYPLSMFGENGCNGYRFYEVIDHEKK